MLVSCNLQPEEKITWNVQPSPEMLVVESIITNEMKQQVIHLTKTNPYFDTITPKGVSNAIVEVNDGTITYSFTESKDSAGWYFSTQAFAGKQKTLYQLSIQLSSPINSLTGYTAQSLLPDGLPIDSMTCEIYKMPQFNQQGNNNKDKDTTILAVYYFGKEPDEAENFYFTKVFRNGKLLYTNPKEYPYFTIAKQNQSFTHIIGFNKDVEGNDSIRFQLYTISSDYYHYLEAVQNIDISGNAYSMSGPPANAVGNVESGKALGYFLAAYVSEKKAKAIDKR